MHNYAIADNFSLLSKLMDIHGENSFKTKSYSVAAFTIEKLPVQLADLPEEKIVGIKGIGDAIGKKITEQLHTGRLSLLDKYLAETPPGVIEMLAIKGLGPKKIATVWKDLEVESIGELLYACNENRLLLYKGFGEKTQQNIREAIQFYLGNKGSYLYAQVVPYANIIEEKLATVFSAHPFLSAGEFRRHIEVIDKLEWVTTVPAKELCTFFESNNFETVTADERHSQFKGPEHIVLHFYHTNKEHLYWQQFITSCSELFLQRWNTLFAFDESFVYTSEEDIFLKAGIDFIPAFLREDEKIIQQAAEHQVPYIIKASDITGIIHSHTTWSDGVNTIEEMARAAIAKGLQYIVISDHSKTAFYANGLNEERLKAQQAEIDELNTKLAPFYIFKSIESDILNDGSLDYTNEVLNSFDLVIASVHSNLKMTEEKAMSRLLKAIENPYTTILGHMTGRLLLSRNGYPVDHTTIIKACAANNVVIELNAHPSRLDIDWRKIGYALEKNVLISIDPDAHAIEGFGDLVYGVLAAQKAGVTKAQNLSSYSLAEFREFIESQKKKRP